MFFRNERVRQEQRGSMPRTYLICAFISLAFIITLATNFTATASLKAAYKYQEIKTIAKGLKKEKEVGSLEKLVEKSEVFIAAHPEYKRVDEVHYLLGNALVQLDRVEEGIKAFEKVIKEQPEARYVERCLLDLGLAYDKLGNYDAADKAYQQLVDHPKYGSRSQAKLAKQLLKQEKTERKGELPSPPGASMRPSAWIGKQASDFQVTDLKGETLSLKEYRGQVVLLDFWATWCPPCIAEIPNIKKTYETYKDQKFQIIGISLDRSIEPLTDYIEKQELGWIHHWDKSGKIGKLYNVTAIPSTFLIDGEGIIRKTNLRGPALNAAVAKLVKENSAPPASEKAEADSQ